MSFRTRLPEGRVASNTLFIDRQARRQSGVVLRQALGISILRLAYLVSRPFGNLGITRINRVVGRALLGKDKATFALNEQTTFRVPAGDYYWAMLYNYSFHYEPELERLFHAFRDIDYLLFDLGANYGYWSILASSPEFGSKRVVAVEASQTSFDLLVENAAQHGSLITVHQGAIWDRSGEVLEFFGSLHAGRSLLEARSDGQPTERVTTVTVADLVSKYADKIGSRRLVVKLDVEGVEMAAVEGAAEVMDRIDVIIFEENNKLGFGETFLKLREMTGFQMYLLDKCDGVFRKVDLPYTVFDPTKRKRALQSIGFNFIAVRPGTAFARLMEKDASV